MIPALTAHPIVAVTEVRHVGGLVGQVGELVKDHLGTEPGQGLGERVQVEDVTDNRLGANPAEQAGLAGCVCHPGDHVPAGNQQRGQPDAKHAGSARDEDSHR